MNAYAYIKGIDALNGADRAFINLNKDMAVEDLYVCRFKYQEAKYYLGKIQSNDIKKMIDYIDRRINALDNDYARQCKKVRDMANAQYLDDLIAGLRINGFMNVAGFVKSHQSLFPSGTSESDKEIMNYNDYELKM